jgi:hypothetical protein
LVSGPGIEADAEPRCAKRDGVRQIGRIADLDVRSKAKYARRASAMDGASQSLSPSPRYCPISNESPTGLDKFVGSEFGRTERSGVRPKGRTQDVFGLSLSPRPPLNPQRSAPRSGRARDVRDQSLSPSPIFSILLTKQQS